jgi:hypothetical protein
MVSLENTLAKQNNHGVTKMRLESCQLFAQLLEGYVDEASTSISLISGQPGGKEVIQKLHQDMKLAHDQDYRQVEKISWSDLKDSYRGAWVIIQGTKGTGAIKARGGNTGSYEAVASAGGEVKSATDSRGGNIIDFLKGEIGKLQKFYVGKNTTAVQDKQKKRADAQRGADTTEINNEVLVKKFKPLWAKAIQTAMADIKGHVTNMIKNDAFEKAKKKLERIEKLQNGLEALENGTGDSPDFISAAVNTAVLMAASHYYPETTGNITRSYGSGYSSQFPEGPRQLLKDISGGDTKKIGAILTFFKRALISG